MSVYKIPNSQKQIIQSNDGDYKGNLWQTYNIDLDSNPGTIKVAPKLTRVVDATQWGTGDVVQALQIHDNNYYIATTEDVFSCTVTNDPRVDTNWSSVGTLGTEDLGLETDMTSFKGLLLISLGTDIMSWDGSTKDDDWWTAVAGGTALTANKVHTMEVLRTGNDTLFITDGNKVRYYNTAAAGTIITLDTLMTAHSLIPSLDRMWVGTYTEVENHAYVYEIRVGDSTALQAYEIEGRVALAMFTYKNTPFVLTELGYIQTFNGVGFQTVAQFPWSNESKVMEGCRPGNVQEPATAKAIHPKGVKVKGKYAYIFVNTSDEFITSDVLLSKRAASGVWVLDLETYSLTHKYALNGDQSGFGSDSIYGNSKVDRSGPILITNTPETRIMVGAEAEGRKGVYMESTEVNQGYFTTTRHEADSVADAFETFVVKADTLDTSEQIVVSYKDKSLPNLPLEVLDITWLNATQFTTTNALTNVEEGFEVIINSGWKAGEVCYITNIEGTTTKTVTVDASLGTLNELSDVYIDSFKKIQKTMTADDGEYMKFGTPETSPSRQYKVIMKGDITLREVISKSNNKKEL